jgi:hypothetical protein
MTLRSARLDVSVTLLGALAAGRNLERAIQFAAVLFVTALTAAAAQVSVPLPFTPVPFTLQPMVVLLGGAALACRSSPLLRCSRRGSCASLARPADIS